MRAAARVSTAIPHHRQLPTVLRSRHEDVMLAGRASVDAFRVESALEARAGEGRDQCVRIEDDHRADVQSDGSAAGENGLS